MHVQRQLDKAARASLECVSVERVPGECASNRGQNLSVQNTLPGAAGPQIIEVAHLFIQLGRGQIVVDNCRLEASIGHRPHEPAPLVIQFH